MSPARLFLDASVWIAAAASPEGGSSALLVLTRRGHARALASRLILRESERNIEAKLGEKDLLRFYELLGRVGPEMVDSPTAGEIRDATGVVGERDAHVLAAARRGHATHLVTLDRKHFLEEHRRLAILPIVACTPGEFLQGPLGRRSRKPSSRTEGSKP